MRFNGSRGRSRRTLTSIDWNSTRIYFRLPVDASPQILKWFCVGRFDAGVAVPGAMA